MILIIIVIYSDIYIYIYICIHSIYIFSDIFSHCNDHDIYGFNIYIVIISMTCYDYYSDISLVGGLEHFSPPAR